MKISSINLISYHNSDSKVKPEYKMAKLPQLKQDTVSFGNASKVGTDVILDLLRRSGELLKIGRQDIVRDAAGLIQAGKINDAIKVLSEVAPPNGSIIEIDDGIKILARNWDGNPIEHVYKNVKGFKNLGLMRKIDDLSQVYIEAFGCEPKCTVGMVGWTNVKPETVLGKTGLTKAELTKLYEEAIAEFFKPVDRYLEGLGINPKDRALVSSVSYSGVDKAIMDMGERNGINTLTITPFDYSIYGRNEHPFPTIITDTIAEYVDLYGKLSKIIIVTGGRDHAFKYDAGGKWLKQNEGILIPIDVLKEFKGIIVPATVNGKIENAAAAAYETFADPLPVGLVKKFDKLPDNKFKQDIKHPAQKALASAIGENLGLRF